MDNDIPAWEHLSEIKITYSGHHGGYDIHMEGVDSDDYGTYKKWDGRSAYLQGVIEVLTILKNKSPGRI